MQHLNKFWRSTITVLLSSFLLFLSQQSHAFEIKVYLHKEHIEKIIGIEEVKAQGHTINFIYLDRLEELEDQISQRVTGDYQESIDKIIDDVGLDNLIAMDDIERTEFFMRRFVQMNLQPVSPKSVRPSELSDIRFAIGEIIKAEEQGIDDGMLPAVLAKGKLSELTYDLTKVIQND